MNNALNELEKKLIQEYEKLKMTVEKPNILLIGGTGVGKSSLVNLCFGKNIAQAGVGKPVTQSLQRFEIHNTPIVLFDTKGYELGSEKHDVFLKEVVNYAIENKMKKENQIHIVWYCIQAPSHRILDLDIKIIKQFKEIGLPVGIVFTKCDLISEKEMHDMDQEIFRTLPAIPQFQVTTKPLLKYLDIEKLCSWSIENLPKGLKFAFISAQKVSLKEKKEEARSIVIQHSSASAFVGFVPIQFSDAPILLDNQSEMMVRILFVYDMQSLIPTIQGMVDSLGLSAIVSNTGTWLTRQLLRIIPGLGPIIGGLISASVAASLTSAIGFSIIEFSHRVYSLVIEGNLEKIESYMNNAETLFERHIKDQFENLK
jgi:GTP-binding protein EngB required for normal cell division/uncharacterized protein (DUF697 family)